jgi:hypothetical protein
MQQDHRRLRSKNRNQPGHRVQSYPSKSLDQRRPEITTEAGDRGDGLYEVDVTRTRVRNLRRRRL